MKWLEMKKIREVDNQNPFMCECSKHLVWTASKEQQQIDNGFHIKFYEKQDKWYPDHYSSFASNYW